MLNNQLENPRTQMIEFLFGFRFAFAGLLISSVSYVSIARNVPESVLGPRVQQSPADDQPLFLTPYIERKELVEAKRRSRVTEVPGMNCTSFSGFLTVRPKDDAHLFFWFFPAFNRKEKAPFVLWLSGGPGTSALTALFAENGPYSVTPDLTLRYRQDNWAIQFNMLYIDSPVGVGYSFANAYRNTTRGIADDIYVAIVQFFTVFDEYSSNEFYIAGNSFGGRVAVLLADVINSKNPNNPNHTINLKGIYALAAYIDPVTQLDVASYWYQVGLLDSKDYQEAKVREQEILEAIQNGNYTRAYSLIIGYLAGTQNVPFLLQRAGFTDGENLLESQKPPVYWDYPKFVTLPDVQQAAHAGDRKFTPFNYDIGNELTADYTNSVLHIVGQLLDKGYKFLMMSGNLDIFIVPAAYHNMIRQLPWKHAAAFNATERVIWKVDNADPDFAGYVSCVKNLCHAIVRNAGHRPQRDQVRATADLLRRFIYGIPFNSSLARH